MIDIFDELKVISREGLIYMKKLRGSGQDLDDIKKLNQQKN